MIPITKLTYIFIDNIFRMINYVFVSNKNKIRTKNIAKDNFQFTPAQFLDQTLKDIEKMPLSWLLKKLAIETRIQHP